MRKTVVAIVSMLMATIVFAEAPAPIEDYFEGPAGFLITRDERKEWKQVSSPSEAEAFIELFWAKRDPDLSTPLNEFREDFLQRVEAADAMYAYGSTRGAMSDRGQVLILLGKYSRKDNRPPGAPATGVGPLGEPSRSGGSLGSAYEDVGSTEVWEYVAADLPVKIGKQFLYVYFVESRVGMNDYVLDRAHADVMQVLAQTPETFIKHPDLKEVPRIGLLPGTQPATAAQLEWFEAGERPWPDGAEVVAVPGLLPGPRHFLWLHLELPEGLSTPESAVGRLREADSGEDRGSFVLPLAEAATGDGAYELSIPVEAGRWQLDLALASGSVPVAVTTVEMEAAEAPATGTAISPFCWGTQVRQEPDFQLGDPFNIGGWHITPMFDSTFPASSPDSINYMAYVINPELSPEGATQFEFSISLYVDGRRVAKTPFQPAQLSKIMDGLWMFGNGLPLERFHQPGNYKLEVELKQSTDSTTAMAEIPFTIVGESTPP